MDPTASTNTPPVTAPSAHSLTPASGAGGGLDRRSFMIQSAGALAATAIIPQLSFAEGELKGTAKVGVIGCGRQGRDIIGELGAFGGVTIGAICDTDDRRLRSTARRAPAAQTYEDYRFVLDSDCDSVVVATPTHLHREIVEAAVEAGKHVYCEAPLAHTVEDARAIAAAGERSSKVFQSGFLARSNPVYDLARTFFRSDAVRDVVSMQAARSRKLSLRIPSNDPAREKALNWFLDPDVSLGLPGEWGSHQFDVFAWYRGRFPVAVQGSGSVRHWMDGRKVADTVTCLLTYDDGTVLTYNATLANSYLGEYELLRGTNAAIRLAWSHGWMFKEADAPTQGWEVYANRQQFHNDEGITLIAGATQLAEQGKLQDGVGLPYTSLYYGLESFLRAVTGEWDVKCTAADGLASTIVGIKAAEAVASGSRVEIDPGLFA